EIALVMNFSFLVTRRHDRRARTSGAEGYWPGMGPIPPAPIPMPPATRAPNRGASTVLLRRVECAHHFGGRKVRRPAPWVEPRDYLLDDRLRVEIGRASCRER